MDPEYAGGAYMPFPSGPGMYDDDDDDPYGDPYGNFWYDDSEDEGDSEEMQREWRLDSERALCAERRRVDTRKGARRGGEARS